MPTAHVVKSSLITRTFRVEQVAGMFDVPHQTHITHEWDATLPLEEKSWNIGLIVGPSGAGKSVLGRELFPGALFVDAAFEWPNEQSVLDGFALAAHRAAVSPLPLKYVGENLLALAPSLT